MGFLKWLDRKIDDQYSNEGEPAPPPEEPNEAEMAYRSTPWYTLSVFRPRVRPPKAPPPTERPED